MKSVLAAGYSYTQKAQCTVQSPVARKQYAVVQWPQPGADKGPGAKGAQFRAHNGERAGSCTPKCRGNEVNGGPSVQFRVS